LCFVVGVYVDAADATDAIVDFYVAGRGVIVGLDWGFVA
jgi:hypothetical protein